MSEQTRRASMVITLSALATGLLGLIITRDLALTARRGKYVWALVSMNRLGALVTVALCVLALSGAAKRSRAPLALAGGGFALAAATQLFQMGASTIWFGGRANTFSFFLAAAAGLLVLVIADGTEVSRSDSHHTTTS